MDLSFQFQKHVDGSSFWKPSDIVIVAVSGGVDSMVLLDLMDKLPENICPQLIAAHVNHQLRTASDKEEAMVRRFCEQRGVPLFVKTWHKKEHPGSGTEEAARRFRYHFFSELMGLKNAAAVLTAHHQGDQAETILMRLMRGSSLPSLTGIQEERHFNGGKLIRPLLPFSKERLYQYASAVSLPYMEDASNQDLRYTRNRVRHQLLPQMQEVNPQVEEHLSFFAEEMTDLLSIANEQIKPATEKLIRRKKESVEWQTNEFFSLSPSLRRFVLEEILEQQMGKDEADFRRAHLPDVIRWMRESGPNTRLELPNGWRLQKRYDICILTNQSSHSASQLSSPIQLVPGEWVALPEGGRIGLFSKNDPSSFFEGTSITRIGFSSDNIELPLLIRHRLPGDRMLIEGTGTKKLKDLFIDLKIPVEERDRAIVIVDAKGAVLWVPGVRESALSNKPETDTIQYILIYEETSG